MNRHDNYKLLNTPQCAPSCPSAQSPQQSTTVIAVFAMICMIEKER